MCRRVKYQVFAKGELIGESQLESGDPPMGVAYGDLVPTDQYWQYQAIFETQDFEAMEMLSLRVVSENGIPLEPCSGVGIEDVSKQYGEQAIEVSVLGLDGEVYEKHFPHLVSAYEEQFK